MIKLYFRALKENQSRAKAKKPYKKKTKTKTDFKYLSLYFQVC